MNTSYNAIQPAMDQIMALKPDIVLNCGFAYDPSPRTLTAPLGVDADLLVLLVQLLCFLHMIDNISLVLMVGSTVYPNRLSTIMVLNQNTTLARLVSLSTGCSGLLKYLGWDSRVNGAGYAEDIASSPTNLYTSTANNTSASQYQADFLAHWSNPYGQIIATDQVLSHSIVFAFFHPLLGSIV